ncbi:MAG: SpaA isopeptide-forming pilin-related protein [Anaerovoracaceae bacterium]|jgi:hypothetical protein
MRTKRCSIALPVILAILISMLYMGSPLTQTAGAAAGDKVVAYKQGDNFFIRKNNTAAGTAVQVYCFDRSKSDPQTYPNSTRYTENALSASDIGTYLTDKSPYKSDAKTAYSMLSRLLNYAGDKGSDKAAQTITNAGGSKTISELVDFIVSGDAADPDTCRAVLENFAGGASEAPAGTLKIYTSSLTSSRGGYQPLVTAGSLPAENADSDTSDVDAQATARVQFSKLDAADKDAAAAKQLAGAKLRLLSQSDSNITEWTTEAGMHSEILDRNKVYAVMEMTPPEGYKIADPVLFRVNDSGRLEIAKGIDIEAATKLTGEDLEKYLKENITWDEQSRNTVTLLDEKDAASGTAAVAGTTGTAAGSKVDTGDDFPVTLCVVLLIIAGAAIAIALLARRKKAK